MAIEKFIDELGSDLNKFQVTTEDGSTYEIKLLRKANITQVGTPLNANKLNQLVDAINTNSAKQVKLNNVINNTPEFYAPTSGGTSGQYLKSNGTSAPTWIDFPKVVKNVFMTGDQNGPKIGVHYTDNTSETLLRLRLSNFTDDVGYAKTSDLSKVATSGSYNDLRDKPEYNLEMATSTWSLATDKILPSQGVYIISVAAKDFGAYPINLGVVVHQGNKALLKYFRHNSHEFIFTLEANGKIEAAEYDSEQDEYLGEVQTAKVYFIKINSRR